MRNAVLSVAAAALVLAACGGGSSDDTGAADSASASASDDAAGRSVALANGGTVELDTLAGQDVLLWFWAPW